MSNRRRRRPVPPPLPADRETTAVEVPPVHDTLEMPAAEVESTPVEPGAGPIHREAARRGVNFEGAETGGEGRPWDAGAAESSDEHPDLSDGDGDVLVVGGTPEQLSDSVSTFVGELPGPQAEPRPGPPAGDVEKTEILSIDQVAPPPELPPVPMLLVELADGTSSDVEVTGDRFVIGRAPECDAVIPDRLASRRHAVIERSGGEWLISDQQSGNGTMLNGERIEQAVLRHGDVISIGGARLTFQLPEQAAAGGVESTMMLDTARVEGGTTVAPALWQKMRRNKPLMVAALLAGLVVVAGVVKLAMRPSGPTPEQIAEIKRQEELRRRQRLRRQAREKFEQVKQLVKQGQWEEARPLIEQVAEVLPDDETVAEYRRTIEREYHAEQFIAEARQKLAAGEFEAAALAVNKVPEDSLQVDLARQLKEKLAKQRLESLLEQARRHKDAGELEQAQALLEEALQANPQDDIVLALHQEVTSLIEKAQARNRRQVKKTTRSKPRPQPRSTASLLKGASLQAYLQGDVAQAITAAPQAGVDEHAIVQLRKFDKLYQRGEELSRNPGQAARAEGFLLQALQLDKRLGGGRGKLAKDIAAKLGKVYFVKGIDALNRKKYPEAFSAFKAALKYRPDLKQARRRLADLQRQARTLYETAYVYKSTEPERAIKMCQTVLHMVEPTAYAYGRCKKLLAALQGPPDSSSNDFDDF